VDLWPTHLDGNAASGPLAEVFGFDITTAVGACSGCGDAMAMAQAPLYASAPGLVLRCRTCDHVLARFVTGAGGWWLDLRGLAYLQAGSGSRPPAEDT
jgi:hypothetical protein